MKENPMKLYPNGLSQVIS